VPPVGAVAAAQVATVPPPSVTGFVPELEPEELELEPDEPELERPPELELEPEEPELEPDEPELERAPELEFEPELEPEEPELEVDEPALEPDEPELEPPPELPDTTPDPPEPELELEPAALDWEPEPESEPQPVSDGEEAHAANATMAAVGNRRERTLMTGTLLVWCSRIRRPYASAFLLGQNLTIWLNRQRRPLAQHELPPLYGHGTRGCRPFLIHTFWNKMDGNEETNYRPAQGG
jgi:hypothetical protein